MKKELPEYLTVKNKDISQISLVLQRPYFEPDNGATSWYATIGLGTPAQKNLRFMIDTGTKNTWITSSLCVTEACAVHNKFNPELSSTYKNDGAPESINFGAWGVMTITPSKDFISLPGIADSLEVEFDMSTYFIGSQFQKLISDGGIGIPANLPSIHNSTVILDLLKQKGLIYHNIASFWYNRTTLQGQTLLGGVDTTKFDLETINIVELISFPTDLECWIVNLESMKGIFSDGSKKDILDNVAFALDTGSSQFKGDPKFIDAAKKVITNQGQYPEIIIAPAAIKDYPYPVLELVLNGIFYQLPPEKYFIQVSENEWHLAFHYLDDCENEFLVGTTFLESIYSIFDFDNRCVVLAERK